MRAARGAVDTAFSLTGAGAVHASHPNQRSFRDLHTAGQHVYSSPAEMKRYAHLAQPNWLI